MSVEHDNGIYVIGAKLKISPEHHYVYNSTAVGEFTNYYKGNSGLNVDIDDRLVVIEKYSQPFYTYLLKHIKSNLYSGCSIEHLRRMELLPFEKPREILLPRNRFSLIFD